MLGDPFGDRLACCWGGSEASEGLGGVAGGWRGPVEATGARVGAGRGECRGPGGRGGEKRIWDSYGDPRARGAPCVTSDN